MKRFLVFVLSIVLACNTFAADFDSLWSSWNDISRHDTDRMNALYYISRDVYLDTHPDSARYYAEMEFQFAKELGNAKFMAEALSLIGSSYKIMGVYDKAIEAYLESIDLNKKTGNKYYIIGSFNGLGNVYLSMDDYVSAMKQYQYALEVIEDIETLVGKGGVLNNIGEIYRETGDHQQALVYYTKSYNLHKKLEEYSGMATALLNIGEVHKVEACHYQHQYSNRCQRINR